MTKLVYNYSSATGEFISESVADESPMEPGIYLLPAYATWVAPPKADLDEIAIFADGGWTSVPKSRLTGNQSYDARKDNANKDSAILLPGTLGRAFLKILKKMKVTF